MIGSSLDAVPFSQAQTLDAGLAPSLIFADSNARPLVEEEEYK